MMPDHPFKIGDLVIRIHDNNPKFFDANNEPVVCRVTKLVGKKEIALVYHTTNVGVGRCPYLWWAERFSHAFVVVDHELID